MRSFYRTYVPFLLSFLIGVLLFEHISIWVHVAFLIPIVLLPIFVERKIVVFSLCLILFFEFGILDRQFRENCFQQSQSTIEPYLKQKMMLEGKVVSFPIPSSKKYSYAIETSRIMANQTWEDHRFHIQLTSNSFQAPQKGDWVRVRTKLYVSNFLKATQKIKAIDAYGTVHGDKNFEVLAQNTRIENRIRTRIFDVASANMAPVNYGYFRAMVFGDQALLSKHAIQRLKETGLFHLFVVSGSHIVFAWRIGFLLCRLFLSGFTFFHSRKSFFMWIELTSIVFVIAFLFLINPPISSFRAVASMILFLLLKMLNRNQNPIRNLGVVFFLTMIFNPLYLLDISTQLTFASVAGILTASHYVREKLFNESYSWFAKKMIEIIAITTGAGLFTAPILYVQFGTFYPMSFVYNLLLTPTLGAVVSCLSVASIVWTFIPVVLIQNYGFQILDFLFTYFERAVLWEPKFAFGSQLKWLLERPETYWGLTIVVCGVGLIITQRFFKKRTFGK